MTKDNNSVKEALESKEFKEAFRQRVEKDTWGNGLPMVYIDDEDWLVRHWPDGRIDRVNKIK
jgi:hypothetical protein